MHGDFSNRRPPRTAHQFRSGRSVVKLWLGSAFLVLFLAAIPITLGIGIYVLLFSEQEWMVRLLIMLGATTVLGFLSLVFGHGAICPLCRGRLLHLGRSSRNSRAKTSFGSYRLGVATRVLTGRTFRCPHCGEPCRCESRI